MTKVSGKMKEPEKRNQIYRTNTDDVFETSNSLLNSFTFKFLFVLDDNKLLGVLF